MGHKGLGIKREVKAPPCSLSPLYPLTQIWGLDKLTLKYPPRLAGSQGSGLSSIPPTFHFGLNLRAEDPGEPPALAVVLQAGSQE